MERELPDPRAAQPKICPDPVFIVGSPRSATTALAWALSIHSRLWTSGESYVLYELYEGRRVNEAFERSRTLSDGSWFHAQGVTRAEYLEYLGMGMNALFTSRSQGKRWVDHTPHHVLMADTLADMFPGARFLHILRDGRKVVHSMVNFLNRFENGPVKELIKSGASSPWALDFREACRTWRRYVVAALDFCERRPDRSLTITTEELGRDPDGAFGRIFESIHVPPERAPIQFFQSRRMNSSFQPSAGPAQPAADDLEPWREWSLEQQSIFIEEAGSTLVRCGYISAAELQSWSAEVHDPTVHEFRAAVAASLPRQATVVVVSKGDTRLVDLDGRTAWHFPQDAEGVYAGYHPADSAEAIEHLESLRRKGGQFLAFPESSRWWLDSYPEFAEHLDTHYARSSSDRRCLLYQL